MKSLFLNYDLSLKAKEKGFNEPCLACYDKNNMLSTYTSVFDPKDYNGDPYCISAPTYQEIIGWLIGKHNIYVYFIPFPYESRVEFHLMFKDETGAWSDTMTTGLDDSIEKALKLI